MSHVRSTSIHHRNDLPAGLPAIWDQVGDHLAIYLRDDLPPDLVDHFVVMAGRDAADLAVV